MIETPTFSKGAVAAPHHLAAEAGRAMLAEKGNAIEAMLAMAATIAVVYPHMNSFGGDAFWLIREPGGRMRYIEAAGFAGSLATIRRYREMGHDSIPMRGPQATLTVPGAVGGWVLAQSMAKALGGQLPLSILLEPSICHASNGYPVSSSEARGKPNEYDALKEAPGFAETYLANDALPTAGTLRKPAKLGDMLRQMADAGYQDFYRGDIAREIAADLSKIDAPVTREDLERFEAIERLPLHVRLRHADVYNAPPPTQGVASLIILALYDRLVANGSVGGPEGFEHHHALIEASKHGLSVRDRIVTDFDRLGAKPEAFLTKEALDRRATAIDMGRAAPFPLPQDSGDTIWMGAIDQNGLAVSYIQSIYWEYGSGCVLPRTGVLMQNRGGSFSLDPASRNPLQPGRRPFHTLNPAIAALSDGRVICYGSMGGDGQPQFQAQLFARYAHFGMRLADAVDMPRWLLGRTWGQTSTSLKYEDRFDDSLIRALDRAGHNLEPLNIPYSETAGHAGAVVRHPKGRYEAVHDPRSDGGAAGIS